MSGTDSSACCSHFTTRTPETSTWTSAWSWCLTPMSRPLACYEVLGSMWIGAWTAAVSVAGLVSGIWGRVRSLGKVERVPRPSLIALVAQCSGIMISVQHVQRDHEICGVAAVSTK
eukprot:3341349-Rhodomonas_salina.1